MLYAVVRQVMKKNQLDIWIKKLKKELVWSQYELAEKTGYGANSELFLKDLRLSQPYLFDDNGFLIPGEKINLKSFFLTGRVYVFLVFAIILFINKILNSFDKAEAWL